MAPQTTQTSQRVIRTVPWNSAKSRLSPEEFHEKNLEEGFVFFSVDIDNATDAQIVAIQNKIKLIDEKANVADEKTGRRIPHQKPYFRYTSIQPDGTENTHGGGWYLYTGWSDTNDHRFHRNSRSDLKGNEPVYFRAKSAVQNSKVPNFSIQWRNVKKFYYKFPPDSKTSTFTSGNKVIKITGLN